MALQLFDCPVPSDRPLSVALGAFDGVHCGHIPVLQAALDAAQADGCPAVFSFANLIGTVKKTKQLISTRQYRTILMQMGFERLYLPNFQTMCDLSPREFVTEILHQKMHVKHVACGFNYRFGCGGSGGSAELRALCEPLGIRVTVVPPLMAQDRPISSTRIRQLVADGAMEQAAQLLGRPYAIDFAVVHGRALGRTLGLPTINQPFPENFVLPRFGVYASAVQLDGRLYHAVTNVGVKPTVGASGPLAETYIVGYSGDLYDQHVTVQLRAFLRPEEKFPSIEALKQQIERDCTVAQQILHAKNME